MYIYFVTSREFEPHNYKQSSLIRQLVSAVIHRSLFRIKESLTHLNQPFPFTFGFLFFVKHKVLSKGDDDFVGIKVVRTKTIPFTNISSNSIKTGFLPLLLFTLLMLLASYETAIISRYNTLHPTVIPLG